MQGVRREKDGVHWEDIVNDEVDVEDTLPIPESKYIQIKTHKHNTRKIINRADDSTMHGPHCPKTLGARGQSALGAKASWSSERAGRSRRAAFSGTL